MATVSIKNVYKQYGDTQVLNDINLEVGNNELIVMVGPSGCGKTTLLRMIAGLETITSGTISIDGEVVNDMPSSLRGIAMVFQSYALYPHMTVRNNMAFALTIQKMPKHEIDKKVSEVAEYLQLTPYLDRFPKALSGGQRQRVAIGRAVIREPRVFLFDEPLSNLDASLRVATRIQIVNLNEQTPQSSMLYVTHDQVEAMTLADRILVLSDKGTVEQVGTPVELYLRPANLFVARFIGSPSMNILSAKLSLRGSNYFISVMGFKEHSAPMLVDSSDFESEVMVGIRAEDFELASASNALISGNVIFIEILGDATQLHVRLEGLEEHIIVKVKGIAKIQRDEPIHLTVDPFRMHLFNSDGLLMPIEADKSLEQDLTELVKSSRYAVS